MTKLFVLSLSLSTLLTLGCSPEAVESSLLDSTISKIQSGANAPQQSGSSASPLAEKTVGSILLRPAKLLDGELELLVPAGFLQMDESTIRLKYPNESPPTIVLSNDTASVNVAINQTGTPVAPHQLSQVHQQLDAAIRQSQPEISWKFNGFQTHHGRKWIQLEFRSQAVDTQIYNMIMATSANGKMLVVSFNCTESQSLQWLDVGREIINSCRVHGR